MDEIIHGAPSIRVPAKAPPLAEIPLRMWHALREHDAFNAAGAMAFQFFLSLIPLLVLAGFVVGRLVRIRGVDTVMAPILDLLPQAAADLVHKELEGMSGSGSAPVAPLSVLGFLLVASNGTHAMMNVFERAFGAHRRPWWKKRLIASAWLVGVVVSMSFTMWGLTRADASFHRSAAAPPSAGPPSPHDRASEAHSAAAHANAHHPSAAPSAQTTEPASSSNGTLPAHPRPVHHFVHHTLGEKLIAFVVLLIVTLIALATLYRFAIEHPKGIERRVWPGAAISLVFWFPVSYVFGAYVSSLGEYVAYYGSLAAVAVVLIWLYLTSLVLLAGAELNAVLEGVRGVANPAIGVSVVPVEPSAPKRT